MATTISGSSGIDTQTVSVDDGGGTGPSVTIKGGGTSTDNPADNEQTLYLQTRNGTTGLSTGIGLWGTFENYPSDTGARRAADIRAGFNGGTWGNEYISFHVGVGTGVVSNDSAAMTTERLRLTKTAMTANVDIEDTVGNVRAPRYTHHTGGNLTVSDEGVVMVAYAATLSTLTIGTPVPGTIISVYNNKNGASITLACGSQVTSMRKGADNNTTHNATLTLGQNSMTTITILSAAGTIAIVTGTDVS